MHGSESKVANDAPSIFMDRLCYGRAGDPSILLNANVDSNGATALSSQVSRQFEDLRKHHYASLIEDTS